ncbi:hypothetical protein FSP39_025083 [Pinctada imbricata]|uniref:N-acetyltransferase domain-containing protein n=1 Tax=Pinctada imbricata TaxID=66713 RepID=A0AA88YFV6_PINIB|nr:hypothetical protein FSP39_025083 [Pinctada imbricata]
MVGIRLGEGHYGQLLKYLKGFWPQSLMINCWKVFVVAFDKSPASFLSLLLEVDNPALQNKLIRVISGLTQETVELLNERFPNRQYPMKSPEFMWLKHRDNLKVNDSILPDGFYAGAMTQALSEVVVEQATEWRGYLEPVAIYNAATIYDCPYAAVFDKDNVPVGWFVQHCVLGSLNHLFVLPEFRGKGIGKFLIEQASKGALEMDGYAFIQVDTENTLSKKIHKNAGFEMGETLIPYLLLPR